MDYEQKYKEALERARTKLTNEVAADIFPELAESKDERIELLNYLYDVHDDDEERARWIAWLEKQGEQMFADGNFVNMDDVREDFVQEVYRVLDADSTNDRANQIIDAFDNLPTVAIEKQGEQKPSEWSEEDNKMINSIAVHLNATTGGFPEDRAWADKFMIWLKSLKERYTWKPSKKQIMTLRWVLNNVPYNNHKEEISGLLEQIKDFV